MEAIPLIFTIASTALTIGQTISGVMEARSAAKQVTKQAEVEAQLATDVARQRGLAKRRQGEQVVSRGRALFGGPGGVVPGEGSPLFVELENVRQMALAEQDELFRGTLEAYQSRARGKAKATEFRGAIPGMILGGAGQAAAGAVSIATQLKKSKTKPVTQSSEDALLNSLF